MDVSRTTVFSKRRTLPGYIQLREEGKPSLPLSAMAMCRALKHNGKPDYYTFVGHSDKVCSAKCMFVSKGDGWQFV